MFKVNHLPYRPRAHIALKASAKGLVERNLEAQYLGLFVDGTGILGRLF